MFLRLPRRAPLILTTRWIPEQEHTAVKHGPTDYQSPAPNHLTIIKVLILVTVFGWVFFGVMSILCINGRGRAGRWIPEWSLDSEGSRWNRSAIVVWWVAVVVLWPVILPVLVIKNGVRGMIRHCKGRKPEDNSVGGK